MKIPVSVTQFLAFVLTPQIVDSAVKTATEFFEGTPTSNPKKRYDMTPLTRDDFDLVMHEWGIMSDYNKTAKPGKRRTQCELTKLLNEKMGYHKSVSVYSKIWLGKTKREDLIK